MSDQSFEMLFWKGNHPSTLGAPEPNPRTEKTRGMIIDHDVIVQMRDGIGMYVDVYRPEQQGQFPVLVAWSPYGKHCPMTYDYFPTCGVKDDWVSEYTAFEGPDPLYWVPNDFVVINVDARGSWYSPGDLTYWNKEEAKDCHDLIEWAGVQPWSNGKVGMTGVSYLAVIQWLAAETRPPHLAAINPWEGFSDNYREFAIHGGIPDSWFIPFWQSVSAATTTRAEDVVAMCRQHPYFDSYWATKNADLGQIEVPAYIVASWSDHGLHTRGTIEGFRQINSKHKWLEIHGRKKWEYYYQPSSLERQRKFFDHFLKGVDTGVTDWSPVWLEVRERFYVGEFQHENEWPPARTRYQKLYLNAKTATLQPVAVDDASTAQYQADDITDKTQRGTFDFRFADQTDVIGYMKLLLWVQAEGADDMDLFVAIQKLDANGDIVGFPFLKEFENGPVALGWLRVSHRELDETRSTPELPVHKHERSLKLQRGEIVPVEIEIWPSGTRFGEGETLRLVVQGSDIYEYDERLVANRHRQLVNKGSHIIHTGGRYDSHLLIPAVPET